MRFSLATTLPPKNEDMVMGEQCHFGDQKKKKKNLQISFFINLVAIRHMVLIKLNGLDIPYALIL